VYAHVCTRVYTRVRGRGYAYVCRDLSGERLGAYKARKQDGGLGKSHWGGLGYAEQGGLADTHTDRHR